MRLRRLRAGEVELELAEAGEGGRPLLLVHGFCGAKDDFTYHEGWVDRLAERGWHVVAPDLRGHGASDAPDGESAYSFDTYAADVVALIGALGWHRFALLGHSMGGVVAQLVALELGSRVTGLVLMDTTHEGLDIPRADTETAFAIVREHGMATMYELQQERGSVLQTPAAQRLDEERPGWSDFGARKFLACSPSMYVAMATAFTTAADRLHTLERIDVPTLVIVGEQDLRFVGPSERMAKTIPGARLVVVPDAGHSPQFENPDAWWAALTGFLDDLPREA